jgi:acetoin utilization protein AcuB
MGVDEIMSKRIVSVHMDDTLEVVKEIFDNSRFHHLLVVEADELLGVISDRDLLKAISPHVETAAETTRDAETLKKKAHQIMTRKPITLGLNAEIYHAIEIFNTHIISCIPIIDGEQKPVGIISWRDIMKTLKSTP